LAMAQQIVARHGGRVPTELESLTALSGVGRKTANVVLGTAFGIAEGVVVDTHVKRLAVRLGLSRGKTAEQIERDLIQVFPRSERVTLSRRLIQHGRRIGLARRPRCDACELAAICPKIGVAPPKPDGSGSAPVRRGRSVPPRAGARSPAEGTPAPGS